MVALSWTCSNLLMLELYWRPQNWMPYSRCGVTSAENHCPWCTSCAAGNAAHDALGLHCCQGSLLTHVQFGVYQIVWGWTRWPLGVPSNPKLSMILRPTFSIELQPVSGFPCKGFLLLRCRTWHWSLLNFTGFLMAHSSCLSLWMAVLPLSVSAAPPWHCCQFGVMCKLDESGLHGFLPPGHRWRCEGRQILG